MVHCVVLCVSDDALGVFVRCFFVFLIVVVGGSAFFFSVSKALTACRGPISRRLHGGLLCLGVGKRGVFLYAKENCSSLPPGLLSVKFGKVVYSANTCLHVRSGMV